MGVYKVVYKGVYKVVYKGVYKVVMRWEHITYNLYIVYSVGYTVLHICTILILLSRYIKFNVMFLMSTTLCKNITIEYHSQ